ncbi:bifunctional tRNA pseudouridine(32) synthase/23S rRNA pseudouridine(746) synthase RluA [Aestuariibacter halophilus]|uniref:Dual-specificity RNA pseudouridine synthase RluA n=1 Tax=Fluctibacter halophilus TaxID=226011 RepID=A0ABS8GCW8_9ALTE|nr:bifunctional tRNA pseudouridine(32) synthase/23S rRNA pseudouridine(746) synthase RluA [Aestuariibacter halophilus]MCC2617946.1 bifunctional tRNA pseudouridine(32) synthase/23S rRNA pseudouridine(746) synthase RluA [Aestuariibacter halophilus]
MALLHYNPPTTPYLQIVYRDDDLIILDKPSGLLSVPGKAAEHKDSLALRVARVWPEARIVHRLDMATSGLIVMALGKDNHRTLSRQFELRQTHKRYEARVWGVPQDTTGTVNLPLICDWPNRPKQKVDMDNGKPSETHWQVLARGNHQTLMSLTPITGRSHQLRVHMLSLGHPILGDRLYAHEQALAMAPRLQLHACELGLTHPRTGEDLHFHSPSGFRVDCAD